MLGSNSSVTPPRPQICCANLPFVLAPIEAQNANIKLLDLDNLNQFRCGDLISSSQALIETELQVRQLRGELSKQWKPYWVILTKAVIQYFAAKGDASPLAQLQISQIEDVENMHEKKKGADEFVFEVKTHDKIRTQHSCHSIAQLDTWIYQIDKAKTSRTSADSDSEDKLSDSEDSESRGTSKTKSSKHNNKSLRSSGTGAGSDDESSHSGTVEIKKTGDSFTDHVRQLQLTDRKRYWSAMNSDELKKMIAGGLETKFKEDCQARIDSWATSKAKLLEDLRKAQIAEINYKIQFEQDAIPDTKKKLEKRI